MPITIRWLSFGSFPLSIRWQQTPSALSKRYSVASTKIFVRLTELY